MSKIKIKVISVGCLPLGFCPKRIPKWKSEIFEVVGNIQNYSLSCCSDGGSDWSYSDSLLEREIPNDLDGADFLIAIVNVPIENNWYCRTLKNKRIIFSFHETKNFLEEKNLPLENVIYRMLYAYSLVYLGLGKKIPTPEEITAYAHHDTRGCLYDMNGLKTDLTASCHNPILCDDCSTKLRQNGVSNSNILIAKNEIRRIHKDLYYRITDFVKRYPVWTLIISGSVAFFWGLIGSILGSFAFEYAKGLLAGS